MRRRSLLGLAGATLIAPYTSLAQQGKVHRLGLFAFSPNPVNQAHVVVARERLKELGFVEGRNLVIIEQFGSVDPALLRENIQKLLMAKPDLILSFGSANSLAIRKAASSLPIVFNIVGDAIEYGLVTDLARPGNNMTGVSSLQRELTTKRLELLREVLPAAKRILFAGALRDITYVAGQSFYRDIATRLGLELTTADVSGGRLYEAVAEAMHPGIAAIFIFQPLAFVQPRDVGERVIRLADARRIPVFVAEPDWVALGGLLSYGPVWLDETRRAAELVARVLRGANAGDLPIEQTSRFELVVNAKAAKSLGISIPPSLRPRIDRLVN